MRNNNEFKGDEVTFSNTDFSSFTTAELKGALKMTQALAGETAENPVAKLATMSETESLADAEKQARAYIKARHNGHRAIPFSDDTDGSIRKQLRKYYASTGIQPLGGFVNEPEEFEK